MAENKAKKGRPNRVDGLQRTSREPFLRKESIVSYMIDRNEPREVLAAMCNTGKKKDNKEVVPME
jgi:hypothetical protein